jgi:hypothetical protein
MVMATRSNVLATHRSAQLTVTAVGASTVIVLLHAVVESRSACSASPHKLPMVAQFAQRQLVLRRSMPAAQNHARRIARAIGMTGVSVPMVVMVQVVQNVAQDASKVEFSKSMLPLPLVDATATTNMATLTPDLVTCLAAQKIVKVPGALSASARVPRLVS